MALKARRELNNELMLTPFIDLLSTLVCFLLISAVWTTVATMELKQSHGTAAGAPREAAELDVALGAPGSATLVLKKQDKTLKKTELKEIDAKALVAEMGRALIAMKALPTMKNVTVESGLVSPHALASHGDLVAVLDGLRLQGLSNIGVKPSGGK